MIYIDERRTADSARSELTYVSPQAVQPAVVHAGSN